MTDWTPEEFADAFRTAVAMARDAERLDPGAVGELWNLAPNKPALVWALASVPGMVIRGVAARFGHSVTADELLDTMAANVATFEPPTIQGEHDDHTDH